MGIFIHMDVSKSVKKEEWNKVYAETLQLVKAFPLAEQRTVRCKGIDTICLTPTEEHEMPWSRFDKKPNTGWWADGDYETMRTAETYYLPKDLVEDREPEPDAGDALLGVLPAYLDYEWKDDLCSHTYKKWGSKTQGEPYHLYLLAIACLIESRLGKKAFVYGDITRGQCIRAVEMANEFLDEPIHVPDRCSMERFFARVSDLPLTEEEKMSVFVSLYLGTKDAEFGLFCRKVYSKNACDKYWKKMFKKNYVGAVGFSEKLKTYLLWGFDLEELCTFVNYHDKDGIPQYEEFVRMIMDAKVHLPEKNCEDILEIDQEESQPYSIYTLFAQFTFSAARNKKVDRYIPVEEVRKALKNGLGEKCDVDAILDAYLEKEKAEQSVQICEEPVSEDVMETFCEQDASEVFSQVMEIKRQSMEEEMEKYDIFTFEVLPYFEKGNTVSPEIKEVVKEYYQFYRSVTKEERYELLMRETAQKRCSWIVEQNRSILIRDKDWNKIFTDIRKNKEEFARYYPMVRIRMDSEPVRYFIKTIAINDDFYFYCKNLVE